MWNFIKINLAVLLCSAALTAEDSKIIKLIPPKISQETISEEIVCTRPMREEKFNISIEQDQNKTLVHCYGHGGSGWTTLFGSVNKAIDLFESTHPNKETPIRVVGSGCIGLTTAIELTRLGYHVSGISTKSLYDNPSWRAAGYFALVSVRTSPEEQANLNEIGMDTFLTYREIEQGKHPYITREAVKYMPVYCGVETDSGVEDLESRGLIPPREYVALDFGNGVIHQGYVKYMTYFMNTTTLMRQLMAEVNRLGIAIELKEVQSFNEIPEEIIFNCAGLGGRTLNSDSKMIPVRGHLITLNELSGTDHMDYMIYTKVKQEGKEEYIYLFPKNVSVTLQNIEGLPCQGVLGGTFIPHVDKLPVSEQQQLDQTEFKRLLDRNSLFFHGHPFSPE
jgi:D-amino-acid oxidase